MRTLADFKKKPDFRNHQSVIELNRPDEGLRGFVSIHNTTLGPAVGGTRIYPYRTEEEAIADVLRLSFAMTYKCALAGVSFGGGKGVIVGDPKKHKTPALLRAYAEEINLLRGNFYTGEDVGLNEDDVELMLKFSPYFIGRKSKAGDPSPYAALSTFVSMIAACEEVFGLSSLEGRKVMVKGIGKVGAHLVKLLIKEGAEVMIADLDEDAITSISSQWPQIEVVHSKTAHSQVCDIYSPCALGNEFNAHTIPELHTKIICGAANNQLANEEAGKQLFEAGIVFVPDYVANAGGLINVVDELNTYGYNAPRVKLQIQKIEGLVRRILTRSKSDHLPPNQIADRLSEGVLENVKKNGKNLLHAY